MVSSLTSPVSFLKSLESLLRDGCERSTSLSLFTFYLYVSFVGSTLALLLRVNNEYFSCS